MEVDEKQEFKLPESLQKYIDNDNKQYLEEEKQKKEQNKFNKQLFGELQRSMG